MSASITIEEISGAAVTIGFDTGPVFELTGGASSLEIDHSGTTVQIFEAEPEITDLLAQYRLLTAA